jgi:hypothetical protein
MLRPLLLACAAAGGWLAIAGPAPCSDAGSDLCCPTAAPCESPAPTGRVVVDCKPKAPIAVNVSQTSGTSAGAVELAFTVEPLRAFEDLTWEVRVPSDVVLLSGEGVGEAAPGRGEITAGTARVDLPSDGSYRSVVVAARGTFATVDEEGEPLLETVVSTAAIEFGGAPQPDLPVSITMNELGQPEQVIILPSRHQPGR